MFRVKTAIASFILVSTMLIAQDLGSFQTEAVKELYNRGILKNVVEEKDFSKKETFTRYEVATILYNTIKLQGMSTLEGISETETLILKSLVSELASELAMLGAKDRELMDEINKLENRINTKFTNEISRLELKVDRIRLTSNFLIEKDLRNNYEGEKHKFENVEASGTATALVNFTDFAKGRVRYDFDNEQLDEAEINLTNDKFNAKLFASEIEKENRIEGRPYIKLPTFRSTLGIVNGNEVEAEDGIIIQSEQGQKNITAFVTNTENRDMFGIEYISKIGYFNQNEGQDSSYYVSYVNTKERQDNQGIEEIEKDKILAIGGDFTFKISDKTTQLFEIEYSKLRGREDKEGSRSYKFPITKDEATYFYAKTDSVSPRFGRLTFSTGGINTGRWYDLSKAGNDQKTPFRETDIIKMEQDKFGWIFNLDQNNKNWENNFQYVKYGSNDSGNQSAERLATEFAYNLRGITNKARLALEIAMEKDELVNVKSDGELSLTPKLKLVNVLKENTENEFRFSFIDNKDADKFAWKAYADHFISLEDNRMVKLVAEVEENYEITNENKKYQNIKLGGNFEKDFWTNEDGRTETKLVLGARHIDKKYSDSNDEKDKNKLERAFAYFETKYDKFTFKYGGLLRNENYYNENKTIENEQDYDKFTYGISTEYEYNKDFKISLSYGPADFLENNNQLFFHEKMFSDESQEQASLRIQGKF